MTLDCEGAAGVAVVESRCVGKYAMGGVSIK